MRMLAMLAAAALVSCGPLPPMPTAGPPPLASTTLDESLALGVEQTYRAARTAVEAAVDLGLVRGELAGKVACWDRKAYAGVQATRSAYRAGNSRDYIAAASSASAAVAQYLALNNGGTC